MAEKPEDLNLPNAVITRLVKEVLPDGVNISKEARSVISKSASVFVLYTTSCANNIAQKGKRKTLTAQDIFQALEEMEFEQFVDPLKRSLELFRKEQKGKKEAAESRKKLNQEIQEEKEDEETEEKAGNKQNHNDHSMEGEEMEFEAES